MIICVKGTKIGDSLIRDEDGNLLSLYPDTFYPRFTVAYWMLKDLGDRWQILKYLKDDRK